MTDPTISKSQYVKGCQCPKALWLYRHRKDLETAVSPEKQALFDMGHLIGDYARQYWGHGVLINNEYWDIGGAVMATKEHVASGAALIYEATAINPENGCHARADILRRIDGSEEWELIEVKSSTSVKDYHIDDASFQYLVFTNSGYSIRRCCLMLMDNTYVRQGDIDPARLLKVVDITEQVIKNIPKVQAQIPELLDVLQQEGEPVIDIGKRCGDPFECDYKSYCWQHVPAYSVYDVFRMEQAEVIAKQYGVSLEGLPSNVRPKGIKGKEVESYLKDELIIDKAGVANFLVQLQYPLFFLDYETIMPAVPLFNGTRPYQQIPFQFSLHIQEHVESEPQHKEYLHKEQADPRIEFLKNLIQACGSSGSILVYNQTFELTRNKELASDFPQYAAQLTAINNRVVDLLVPFRSRLVYHPRQYGSASIKDVLPAFTSLRYDDLEISHGGDAMRLYAEFMTGNLQPAAFTSLWENLTIYCRQDTWGMVELMRVLMNIQ